MRQAGLKADAADSGAVTLIQRSGSAANLNIRLHCLALDGVYGCDADSDEARVLRPLQAAACTYRIAFGPRLCRYITRPAPVAAGVHAAAGGAGATATATPAPDSSGAPCLPMIEKILTHRGLQARAPHHTPEGVVLGPISDLPSTAELGLAIASLAETSNPAVPCFKAVAGER